MCDPTVAIPQAAKTFSRDSKRSAKPVNDAATPEKKNAIKEFGVSRDRFPELASGETFYSVNGRRVDAEAAFRLIEKGGTLVDDSNKQRLTIIGTPDEVNPVLKDLQSNAKLSQAASNLLVSSYDPSHWAITGVGLPHDGHPTIIVQAPPDGQGRGKVLHVQKDYQGGPEGLATAIRRADPNYDPSKDPDLRKKKAGPNEPSAESAIQPIHIWAILLSLGGLALRQFGPDLIYLWQNTSPKLVGFFQSKKNPELESLKAQLAEQLRRLQAIQPSPEVKPAA